MKIEELKIGDEVFVKGVVSDKTFNVHGNKKFKIRTTPFEDINGFVAKNKLILPDQPKPVVPQVALEYYEQYKNELTCFGEWFEDFYDSYFLKDFPRGIELAKWLHDNDNKTNLQHELALATLIVNGPDAVTVEKEKLYTVEIPNPNAKYSRIVLQRLRENALHLKEYTGEDWKGYMMNQLTESEIKQDFDWAWQFAKEVEY